MSLKYLTFRHALAATTTDGATTNFNHLRKIPRSWLIRRSKYDPKVKSVRPADRIKWWNIIPGDQIRLRGDKTGTIHEVLSINRLSNRVFLKNTSESSKEGEPPQSKNYHYSKCQLYVGEFEVTPKNNGPLEIQNVFALRVGTSRPRYDLKEKRFVWNRYAIRTIPILRHLDGKRIKIPWPKPPVKTYPEPGLYDTPFEEVVKVTCSLPAFDRLPAGMPTEKKYLDHIYNPHLGIEYDSSAPFEIFLQAELANPHSRAKKLERYKSYQAGVHSLLKSITTNELSNLNGRTVRQAKADAAFKWREQVKEEQAKKKKARWMHSAQLAKWDRKAVKKSKKEGRQRNRLTELMLVDEPNQVIPALKANPN